MKTYYRLTKYLIILILSTTLCSANQPNTNVLNKFYLDSNLGTRTLINYSSSAIAAENNLVPQKSANEAFLYSLAIPGMGQIYTGAKHGYIYTAAEVALLTTYFILRNNATNTHDDYEDVVRQHIIFIGVGSFIDWNNEDYEHASDYENWNHKYDSEGTHERTGKWYWKDLDPSLKNDSEVNKPESPIDSKYRLQANELRDKANNTFQTARNILGIVILNHVISAVEARISTKRWNKKQTESEGFQIDVQTDVSNGNFSGTLVLRRRF